MDVDSVRDLKSSLLEIVLPGLSATVRTRGLPGEAVRTLGAAADQPPTLALGIARRVAGDFARLSASSSGRWSTAARGNGLPGMRGRNRRSLRGPRPCTDSAAARRGSAATSATLWPLNWTT